MGGEEAEEVEEEKPKSLTPSSLISATRNART